MKELATRDPREMYKNSRIDLMARKKVKAHRDYELNQLMQKNIVDTFQKAYDEEVEKHIQQEELERQKVKAKELKEQAKRRASTSFDSREEVAETKKVGKNKAKSIEDDSDE